VAAAQAVGREDQSMTASANAGGRLDRLPIGSFHYWGVEPRQRSLEELAATTPAAT